MLTAINKFGENNLQNRLKKRGHSEGLAGQRRQDPQLHATSRPWHTSTGGIHMSVSKMGQIAEQVGGAAKRYLNAMTLSELAQKKRGLDHNPANFDKIGFDTARALKNSVAAGRLRRSVPGQDVVDGWERSLTNKLHDVQGRGVGNQHDKDAIRAVLARIKKMGPTKYF